MRCSTDLSPSAQLLLDYLCGHPAADQFDVQENLGMPLPSALAAADELRMQGFLVEVGQARLTYFRYTDRRNERG